MRGTGQRAGMIAVGLLVVLAMTAPFQQAAAQAPVIITHWQHFHEGRVMALGGLKQVFERQNPGVGIVTDFPPYAGFFEKLVTSLAAGTGPDVFQAPHFMAEQLINGGFLAPVPESVATAADIEKTFFKWTTERFKRGGRHYGMPVDVQHIVLFINDDLARAAGLDPTRPPAT
ncbi:MAG: extracellular solute-binding protein [Armatimonadota bacterium]|nr:extracellular solute-binding protein [Armatimonadota bacterium]MDR7518609.1 extracellular solute-binding protein [Armatimonadota bacterium]MDR7548476.1 extracellular solute-binding protein [Armatimonadota bacterium]